MENLLKIFLASAGASLFGKNGFELISRSSIDEIFKFWCDKFI